MTRPARIPAAHARPTPASAEPRGAELECLRSGVELLALRALGDGALAEEVAQETLVRALAALRQGALDEREKLGAFVRGIAQHVIADIHRRRGRRPMRPLPAEDGPRPLRAPGRDPLAALLRKEEELRVRRALDHLSGEDREILRLSFFEGLRPGEIAAALGEPSARIRKRKSRALQRLRDAFFGNGHDSAPRTTGDQGKGMGTDRVDAASGTGG